jgi:hypothetical protein
MLYVEGHHPDCRNNPKRRAQKQYRKLVTGDAQDWPA